MIELEWWVILVAVAILVAGMNLMQTRGRILRQKERVDQSWREIENRLLDRRNRIPALIKTLENHASSQNMAIDWVRNFAAAVRQAINRTDISVIDPPERAKREDELSKRLRALIDLAGTYPDVMGNPEYREALERLQVATDHIKAAEADYNDNVRDYNERLKGFPNKQIANVFGLKSSRPFRLKSTRWRADDETGEDLQMHEFFARR
ncbi:MAG: LemA family protein [Alphaproteobacteria bacterium]|nr:LemA family protein [Alphaproteobacteria bacterium SS10]